MKLIEFEKLVLEELYDSDIFEDYLEKNLIEIEEDLKYHCIKSEVETEHLEVSTLEYLEEIGRIEFFSDNELVEFSKKNTIEARDELITKGLRIPVLTGMYLLKEGIDYLDLMQEGSIGLIEAIGKFSESGYKSLEAYAKIHIIRRMVIYINEKLLENKAQFIIYFEDLIDEYDDKEDVVEELRRKIEKVNNMNYFDLENILTQLEIDVINGYYGLKDGVKSSMYEIEKKYNLKKDDGEAIFQKGINKLSKFGGEFFVI